LGAIMRKMMTHWSRLPEHLRRGLLRLYVVVSVPWVAWFGYQYLDQAPYYSRSRHAADALWWLLVVPVGGPILLLVIVWVVAGFRKSALGAHPIPTEAATHRSTGDYYAVIAQAVSRLPDNTVEARHDLYDRTRTTFTAQLDGQDPSWIKYERRTLERAIRQVESMSAVKQRNGQTYRPASTILLIASIFFPGLWAMDFTSMSLY
jgi:hypothetical protein